mmetsp:Transcript_3904/g.8659  ORF Transcript_3904/g.8659 Transcript_3904/m.8659 type:complete len:91 (+) Transcript_3904:674-946(+)
MDGECMRGTLIHWGSLMEEGQSPGRTEANTPENGKTAKPTVTVQWTTPLEIGTKATGKTEHASATALTTSKTGVCTPVNGEMLLLMAMEE